MKTLEDNPVRTLHSSNVVKITHRDHHMYDPVTNNVTIAGVSSGYTTTLNGAILFNQLRLHLLMQQLTFMDSQTVTPPS